ncbi:uncharacterized protein LOC135973788 [Chrysemys picta bellii]|uniref:uncharacterized protein LOC135973788 n=1 Tax=Chrysemys picta bellii TaxID=8478 RepID=UPI0032B2FE28
MLLGRAKIKELRQVYHKAREANHRSDATPKTCQFYKELDAFLSGDPTSTAKSPVDTSVSLEVMERGPNPKNKVIDGEVELDDDVQLPAGSPGGAGSQELFSTPEVSSQSQQLLSSEREAGEETPDVAFRNTPHTPAERLHQIRKRPRCSKDNMFWEVLHGSNAEIREHKECWEAKRQDRKGNQKFVKNATEWMIKVIEEQTQMLKSLKMLHTEQIHVCPLLQHSQNSFPCPPKLRLHSPFHFPGLLGFPFTPPPRTTFMIAGPIALKVCPSLLPPFSPSMCMWAVSCTIKAKFLNGNSSLFVFYKLR